MAISGTLNLTGDKSISHRALMLASLVNGRSELRNLSSADDVVSTISCLKSCGLWIILFSIIKLIIISDHVRL